jgi:TPR repeat protein
VLGGVFICYRRDDSAGFAGRIYDRLTRTLGRESVFIDVDNIPVGFDFIEVLSERVGQCDALIAVIGRNWLSSADAQNRRRLDDVHDFVRIEIEAALKRNVPVIPVLVDGAAMPQPEDLPDPLKMLARRQGIEISHNRFDSDAERLTEALTLIEGVQPGPTPDAGRQREPPRRLGVGARWLLIAAGVLVAIVGAGYLYSRGMAQLVINKSVHFAVGETATGKAADGGPAVADASDKATAKAGSLSEATTSKSGNDDGAIKECIALSAPSDGKAWAAGLQGAFPGPRDPAGAAIACRAAFTAHPSDPRVQYALGRALAANGAYDEALTLFRRAAEAEFAPAQTNLAALYDWGKGVGNDETLAFAWYRRAAEQGDSFAQANLGSLYATGSGVKRDDAQALAWIRKSADQGDAFGEAWLGQLFRDGQGVKQDYGQALIWDLRSADQGLATGQNDLACSIRTVGASRETMPRP